MSAKTTRKTSAQRRASLVGSGRMVSRLRRRYTRVVKIGDQWNTYLQIDNQGFWGSQITRTAQTEKRRPMLFDLSDSSGLEKAADRVLTRFRTTTNRAPMSAVAERMRGGSGMGRDGVIRKGDFA